MSGLGGPLCAAWKALCGRIGAPEEPVRRVGDRVAAGYQQSGRHYHDLEHIEEVLATLDLLRAAGEPVADPVAVEFAAWFHDLVYRPGADDNEARSAELARSCLLELGAGVELADRASALVLATADHRPRSQDEALLVDADLAILGASTDRYVRYVADIRAEYAHVDEVDWRRGRSAVLADLLARDPLYRTRSLRDQREERARANLRAELDRLAG